MHSSITEIDANTKKGREGMTSIQDDRFYRIAEVADLMGVSYQTVKNEIHANKLHAVPVGVKPIYRVPGWSLKDYQAGRAPRPASLVASVGGADNH
jgi:excisionase family DNA binding protein